MSKKGEFGIGIKAKYTVKCKECGIEVERCYRGKQTKNAICFDCQREKNRIRARKNK